MTATRCAACGLPGHRFGRNEGMERFDRQACINLLLSKNEELRNEVRRLQAWISDAVESDGLSVNEDAVLCDFLCAAVCAGPCEGRDVGPTPSEATP